MHSNKPTKLPIPTPCGPLPGTSEKRSSPKSGESQTS